MRLSSWLIPLQALVLCGTLADAAPQKKGDRPPLVANSARNDPLIRQVQDDLALSTGVGGYYAATYRDQEVFYWEPMPSWIREDAARRGAGRILDIGCGYGTLLTFAVRLHRAQGYCLDLAEYIKPDFAAGNRIQFSKSNIELDPVPWPGPFDLVLMTEVLEHFNFNPVPTFRKIRAVLAPEGRFYLSTPDASEWARVTRYHQKLSEFPEPNGRQTLIDDHMWIYNKKELLKVLGDSGFAVERLDYSPGVTGRRHFNVVARPR
jgi:SAM-dependent methyltransferase